MIDTNELMIDNWVYYLSHTKVLTPILVESINDYGIHLYVDETREDYNCPVISCDLFASDIEPIPLTEDWLKNLGGEDPGQGDTYGGKLFLIANGYRIRIRKANEKYHWYLNGIEINCNYVHQLQNLYFSLTGNKLNLTQ